jgi:hypothetical protein
MLRVDEVLYGELWVPLERRLAISTELEVPSTVVDPEILRRHLEALDPLHRGIRAALYAAAGVRVNPLSQIGERSGLDHLPFLRMVLPARLLEREFGIPASSLAVAQSPRSLAPSTALVLAGSGVRVIAFTDGGDELIQRLGGPGDKGVWTVNSRVTGQPDELGFGDSDAEMTAFVERWLTATPPLRSERVGSHAVFVIGDDPTAAPAALATVRRWNGRFAYPRIAIGEYADPFPRAPSDQTSARRTVAVGVATNVTEEALSLAELEALRVTRERMVVERADGLVSTAAAVLGRPGAGLQALTEALAVRFSGTLVFNTAPFTRTDVVTLEDGRDAIVTDVPGLGYAFVVGQALTGAHRQIDHGGWRESPLTMDPVIEGAVLRVTLDRDTGSVASLVDRRDGTRLSAAPNRFNAIVGARFEAMTRESLAGVGSRFVVQRRLGDGGSVRTEYTLFESLPWLHVRNHFDPLGAPRTIAYRFGFGLANAEVSWGVPVGWQSGRAPLDVQHHLRWLRLAADERAMLFRGFQASAFSVDQSGTLTSHAPPGTSTYRLAFDNQPRSLSHARQFAWESEPFVTEPAKGGVGGRLPTSAPLLVLEQDDIALLGAKMADDGDGAIVYLQELSGSSRAVSLQPGIVRFRSARRVDFVERDLGPIDRMLGAGILVPLSPHEVAGVRLQGLSLSGG